MTITLTKPQGMQYEEILTEDALALAKSLEQRFGKRRKDLIKQREELQHRLDAGEKLDFLEETAHIRTSDWKVQPVPQDIQDRRVEITGPVDRKMIINALNSGAKVFMADFEDAHSPTWRATVAGQQNIKDAFTDNLSFVNEQGKVYGVGDNPAILMLRLRGWHMEEKNVFLNGERISAGLFDLALLLTHNHKAALENGKGLYFYLPKIEHHLEAKLWNDAFEFCEEYLGLPKSTLRCTVLIETITAAFQMDEILYELKDYIVALNAGRWDYIFNFIKRFKNHSDMILPDRALVGMTTHFLRSYSQLLIQTCHKRGAHAMGGMSAYIPVKNDEKANELAMNNVQADKQREAQDGHDGTWVAHPGLVPIAKSVFDEYMPEPNQVGKSLAVDDKIFTADDLLQIPEGNITEQGIRNNVSVALQYIAAWLNGLGAVPIFNLMEDAATAEISRAQLWQWLKHQKGILDNGETFTAEHFKAFLSEEVEKMLQGAYPTVADSNSIHEAAKILENLVLSDTFTEFLTQPAYELI